MVKIFIYQVRCGKMTVDEVPERWREQVRKELEDISIESTGGTEAE